MMMDMMADGDGMANMTDMQMGALMDSINAINARLTGAVDAALAALVTSLVAALPDLEGEVTNMPVQMEVIGGGGDDGRQAPAPPGGAGDDDAGALGSGAIAGIAVGAASLALGVGLMSWRRIAHRRGSGRVASKGSDGAARVVGKEVV